MHRFLLREAEGRRQRRRRRLREGAGRAGGDREQDVRAVLRRQAVEAGARGRHRDAQDGHVQQVYYFYMFIVHVSIVSIVTWLFPAHVFLFHVSTHPRPP